MAEGVRRPILFLDVDGPVLPFGGSMNPDAPVGTADAHLARLDPTLGARLAALVHLVSSSRGLTADDFAILDDWLRVGAPAAQPTAR